MKTRSFKFNQLIPIDAEKIELPEVQVMEDLQQKVLFTSIGQHKIPHHLFDQVIQIFSDKKYYLEFFLLNSNGMLKTNLGSIRNEFGIKPIFLNSVTFLNTWQKNYQEFAMKVLFTFAPLNKNNVLYDDFIICNVLENNWTEKIEKYVRNNF